MTKTNKTKTKPTFTARCEREDRWWIVTVPDLPGVVTQARNLEAAREFVTEAIALWLDGPTTAFHVELEVVGLESAINDWRAANAVRREAEALSAEAAKRARAAVAKLNSLTVRDASALLGDISPQRVQQLRGAKPAKATKSLPRAPTRHPIPKRVKAH